MTLELKVEVLVKLTLELAEMEFLVMGTLELKVGTMFTVTIELKVEGLVTVTVEVKVEFLVRVALEMKWRSWLQ